MKIGEDLAGFLGAAIGNTSDTGFEQLVYIVNTEFAQAIKDCEPSEDNLVQLNLGNGVKEPAAKSQIVYLPDSRTPYGGYFLLFSCFLPLTDCYPIDWSKFGEISDSSGNAPLTVNGLGPGLGQYF